MEAEKCTATHPETAEPCTRVHGHTGVHTGPDVLLGFGKPAHPEHDGRQVKFKVWKDEEK